MQLRTKLFGDLGHVFQAFHLILKPSSTTSHYHSLCFCNQDFTTEEPHYLKRLWLTNSPEHFREIPQEDHGNADNRYCYIRRAKHCFQSFILLNLFLLLFICYQKNYRTLHMLSLCRGHANLCIVPILVYVNTSYSFLTANISVLMMLIMKSNKNPSNSDTKSAKNQEKPL